MGGWHQVAQEVFGLSRVVRTFGTEEREVGRYRRCLQTLRDINVRQATAYLMYLISANSLFNLTKVTPPFSSNFLNSSGKCKRPAFDAGYHNIINVC